jgi:hypothetical protein
MEADHRQSVASRSVCIAPSAIPEYTMAFRTDPFLPSLHRPNDSEGEEHDEPRTNSREDC